MRRRLYEAGLCSRIAVKKLLYSRNTNISGNMIKHNLRTSMNERTHFFIKIYLSHFILERVDVSVVCERWVETGTDCYIDQTSPPDHSMLCYLQEPTSSASWLELLNRRSPSVGCSQSASWLSLWPSYHQLTQRPLASAYILS